MKLANRKTRLRNGALKKVVLTYLLIDFSKLIPAGSFVAKNWQHGWMGKFMWGVFTNYLGLEEGDIIAMTSANFSMATNPQNTTSVYKGFSTITRCVWEIYLGNVVSLLIVLKTHLQAPFTIDSMIDLVAGLQDLCVGDVWETQERRGLSSFTTAIAVDRFMLITNLKEKSESMFWFPEKVNLDRYVLLCITIWHHQ